MSRLTTKQRRARKRARCGKPDGLWRWVSVPRRFGLSLPALMDGAWSIFVGLGGKGKD